MKIALYGFPHSPWVQAVLLALHDRGIEYDLFLRPPYKIFTQWGVYMPAISINDGPWKIESTEMLVKLGYEPILMNSHYFRTVKLWKLPDVVGPGGLEPPTNGL
tara:strand:- start:1 stop:312 length:312 start_codon:yes stop_codon:yes gene_type:complete